MQEESKARTPGEIHSRLVTGIMTTGIMCALSGGVWISGGSFLADFVSYSASIFTIFAFVATLLQLHSIKQLRKEKQSIVVAEREIQEKARFQDALTQIGWDIEFLRKEIEGSRFEAAVSATGLLIRKYTVTSSQPYALKNQSLHHRLRICANEFINLKAMLRTIDGFTGSQKEEKKQTINRILTYIERENENNINGGGAPARDGRSNPNTTF